MNGSIYINLVSEISSDTSLNDNAVGKKGNVESVVKYNEEYYADETHRFVCMDFIEDKLPMGI